MNMTTARRPDTVDLSSRVAGEIRAEMARQRVTNVRMATLIGQSDFWVGRRLNGKVPIGLDELEVFAQALRVPWTKLLPNVEPSGYRAARTAARSAA